MFFDNIEERKDIIVSKLEYKRKRRFLESDPKFQDKIDIINKVINDEKISEPDFKIFISQLEYTFKQKLLEAFGSDVVDNQNVEEIRTKTDKAIYIITNIHTI